MLVGNNLYKITNSISSRRMTTDDIPEGQYNKYCLEYADGKTIGDIILRPVPNEIACHKLLNGQIIHKYEHPTFYQWALDAKEKSATDEDYEFFNKTLEEYESFLTDNIHPETNQNYCPYFVITSEEIQIYEVEKDGIFGYTSIIGEKDNEVLSGYIYQDTTLTTIISEYDGWFYTGQSEIAIDEYVKLPTFPTYIDGSNKFYYFIIVNSRVNDDTTSIRSVSVGTTTTLDANSNANVKNSGTIQNLVLDFGIPRGKAATIQIGTINAGDVANVINTGNESDAIFNFTFPRGEQGIAGGVVNLTAIVDSLPDTANVQDKYFNKADNNVYIYNANNEWEFYQLANSGLIYTVNGTVYYFDDSEQTIKTTYSSAQVDDVTIRDAFGRLESFGTRTVQGGLLYNWIGTKEEWEAGRADGTILDTYICLVTNDNTGTGGNEEDIVDLVDEINGEII